MKGNVKYVKDAPENRCLHAAALRADPKFRKRIERSRKGKGSYTRKGQLDNRPTI